MNYPLHSSGVCMILLLILPAQTALVQYSIRLSWPNVVKRQLEVLFFGFGFVFRAVVSVNSCYIVIFSSTSKPIGWRMKLRPE